MNGRLKMSITYPALNGNEYNCCMKSRTLRADLLLLLTALIWGLSFVAQRLGMTHIGAFTFNGVRFALGTLVLYPLVRRNYPDGLLQRGEIRQIWLPALLTGLVLFVGASLQQHGVVYTDAGKAGFITGLYVIFVPLMGLLLGIHPGLRVWVGALLAVVGLYLLSVEGKMTLGKGDTLVLIGAVAWAAHVHLVGRFSAQVGALRLAWLQFAITAALSLLAAFVFETITLAGLQAAAWPIIYAGALSVGVGYTLQVVAQKDAPPAHAAILLSLEAVFAALGGWLILGETLPPRGILGAVLMLLGMWVAGVNHRPERKRQP